MIKMVSEPSQRGSIGGRDFEAFLFLRQAGRTEDVPTSSDAPTSAARHLAPPAPRLLSLLPETWLPGG